MDTFLLVGLGNHGEQYNRTRHNIGYMLADRIIKAFNFIEDGNKFHSNFYKGSINGRRVLLIKPLTYMNNSGKAVSEVVNFFKIPFENIFVFQDDLDLDLGKIKFKVGGGAGGHNGIKNITLLLGNENYNRIKIGIGHPQYKNDVINYVLDKFTEDELVTLENLYDKIIANINLLFSNRDLFLTNIYR